MLNPYMEYKRNSILTASPETLVLMLYDGMLRFIEEAKLAIKNNDMEKANDRILRAEDIVNELMATLDMQYKESENILKLYDFILRRLIDANLKKDINILDEAKGFVLDFRDTWKKAMDKVKETLYSKS